MKNAIEYQQENGSSRRICEVEDITFEIIQSENDEKRMKKREERLCE